MQPQYTSTHPNAKDLTGQKFGRLTVVSCAGSNINGRLLWHCNCACGNETVVIGKSLRAGLSKSCGCLQKEAASATRYKHGMSKTRVFKIWQGMIDRCTNSNNPDWSFYGGRGIAVCDRWLNSFADFHTDMGDPPSQQHTLDRKHNDGNYEPKNCRWATRLEQGRNTRRSKQITFQGETLPIGEWAERFGMSHATLYNRVFRYGWSAERALRTPVK